MAPPTRTPKSSSPSRRAGAPRPRPAASSTPRRTPSLPGRRKPEPQSNAKKVVGAVTGALPSVFEKASKPAKKAAPSSKKGGAGAGLAILGAGAAGVAALKNRDKISAKLSGRGTEQPDGPVVAPAPAPVATSPDHNAAPEL